MMTRTRRASRPALATVPCRAGCGRQVRIVRLLTDMPPASWVPLEPTFEPAYGIAPSHALSAGRRTCRPLRPGESPDPGEHPALIHHAVCPALARNQVPDDVVDITEPAR